MWRRFPIGQIPTSSRPRNARRNSLESLSSPRTSPSKTRRSSPRLRDKTKKSIQVISSKRIVKETSNAAATRNTATTTTSSTSVRRSPRLGKKRKRASNATTAAAPAASSHSAELSTSSTISSFATTSNTLAESPDSSQSHKSKRARRTPSPSSLSSLSRDEKGVGGAERDGLMRTPSPTAATGRKSSSSSKKKQKEESSKTDFKGKKQTVRGILKTPGTPRRKKRNLLFSPKLEEVRKQHYQEFS
eukprot:jgi/Bigna1/67230/fgenesh1_pg.3_\